MTSCVLAGGVALALAAGHSFTLEWTHSVEREGWRETWVVENGQMHLTQAAVQGSGAGMEPGPGGHFEGDWWVWVPDLPPVSALNLAASGATPSPWHFCGASCTDLGGSPGAAVHLEPCHEG